MKGIWGALFALLVSGCARDPAFRWAVDTVALSPDGADVRGFVTWHIYNKRWEKKPGEKSYLCAVISEFDGVPANCPDGTCEIGWQVSTQIMESDCTFDPQVWGLFDSMVGVGVGAEYPGADAMYPGFTRDGWIDYGNGLEKHGQAWPAALNWGGAASTGWDGHQSFHLQSALAFDAEQLP